MQSGRYLEDSPRRCRGCFCRIGILLITRIRCLRMRTLRRAWQTIVMAGLVIGTCRCTVAREPAAFTELQRARSGSLDIVLLSRAQVLKQHEDEAVLEFRTGGDSHLVHVGAVRVVASRAIVNQAPLRGDVSVTEGKTPGRYLLRTDLSMAGTWQFTVRWAADAADPGSIVLPVTVR